MSGEENTSGSGESDREDAHRGYIAAKNRDLKKQGDCEGKSHYEDLATDELEELIFSLETAAKRDKKIVVMGKLSAGLRPQQAASRRLSLPAKYSALMCVGRRFVRCMVWAITLCAHSKNT